MNGTEEEQVATQEPEVQVPATEVKVEETPPVVEEKKVSTSERLFGQKPKVEEPATPEVVEEAPKPVEASVVTPPVETLPTTASQQQGPTPEQIAAYQRAVEAQMAQQQPVVQKTPPTQQELEKAMNKFSVDETLFKKIFESETPEESIAAMNQMVQGSVIQAVTMAKHLYENEIHQLRQQLNPYVTYAEQALEHERVNTFYNKNPELKPLESVVNMVTQQMRAEGLRFESDEKAYEEVAKRAKAQVDLLKAAGLTPQTVQTPVATPSVQAPVAQRPQMAALPTGGQGGGGSTSGSTGKQSTAQKLFGR